MQWQTYIKASIRPFFVHSMLLFNRRTEHTKDPVIRFKVRKHTNVQDYKMQDCEHQKYIYCDACSTLWGQMGSYENQFIFELNVVFKNNSHACFPIQLEVMK